MKGFGEKKQSKNNNIRNEEKKLDHNQLIQRAFQFQAQGKKLEAAKCYQYLIKNGLKDYRIFSNYGTFLKEIGKYEEAELELNKAIKLNPRYANAFYNLAGLFLEKGDLLKAETHLRKTIALKSDFAIAHYNLGLILKNMGKLQEAKLHFQKAIEIDPNLTEAYLIFINYERYGKRSKMGNSAFL